MGRFRTLAAIASALAGAIFFSTTPMRSYRVWVDSVTGSVKGQRRWLTFDMTPVFQQSAIERWIIQHEGSHSPRWTFITERYQSITGQGLGWGCGTAPEIHSLHDELNARYVQTASDAEISRFVRIMREGTKAERERAVEEACNKAIEAESKAIRPAPAAAPGS